MLGFFVVLFCFSGFVYFYVYERFPCMYVCLPHACSASEEGIWYPGIGIADCCESLGYWESNPVHLQGSPSALNCWAVFQAFVFFCSSLRLEPGSSSVPLSAYCDFGCNRVPEVCPNLYFCYCDEILRKQLSGARVFFIFIFFHFFFLAYSSRL